MRGWVRLALQFLIIKNMKTVTFLNGEVKIVTSRHAFILKESGQLKEEKTDLETKEEKKVPKTKTKK